MLSAPNITAKLNQRPEKKTVNIHFGLPLVFGEKDTKNQWSTDNVQRGSI